MTVSEEKINDILVKVGKVIQAPAQVVAWVINLASKVIIWVKTKPYDPEKVTCPACGYRGEKSTDHRTCRISCIRSSVDKAVLRHVCYRCDADWYTRTVVPADKWMS